MSILVRSMAARGGRRIAGLCLLPLVTACGVISHNIAENMTESNRLEMLQGMKDDQLCSGYNNHLVGPKTEQQLREVLRARGISKCEAHGRTRVIPPQSTTVAAAAPQPLDGVPLAQKVEDPAAFEREKLRAAEEAAALERERQRVWDEAKKREADRVAAENRAAAEKQAQEGTKEKKAGLSGAGEEKVLQDIFGPLSPAEMERIKTVRPADSAERILITQAVRRSLIDPESARFGDVFVLPNKHACVAVNAKNRFGGFTGTRMAFAGMFKGAWHPMVVHDVTIDKCISMIVKLE